VQLHSKLIQSSSHWQLYLLPFLSYFSIDLAIKYALSSTEELIPYNKLPDLTFPALENTLKSLNLALCSAIFSKLIDYAYIMRHFDITTTKIKKSIDLLTLYCLF